MNTTKSSPLRSLWLGLAVVAAIIIYAYGFDVIGINFAETRDPIRQGRLVLILRAIAKPDILKYEQTEVQVQTTVQVPCPASGAPTLPQPPASGPYIVLSTSCADPRERVTIEGFKFEPDSAGPVNFLPAGSDVSLKLGDFRADNDGHWSITARLPNRPSEEVQTIQSITRTNVGTPTFSQNALDTWDKIIETVFLALLATTIGTVISLFLSFLAAQNIMKAITGPVPGVALSIIVLPIGLFLGGAAAVWIGNISQPLTSNAFLSLGGAIVSPLAVWGIVRWAVPPEEATVPSTSTKFLRFIALLAAALLTLLFLFTLSSLLLSVGQALEKPLGVFGFLGTFIAGIGDIIGLLIVFASAVTVAAVLVSGASSIGQLIVERLPVAACKVVNLILATIAGALLFGLIGAGIGWLYEISSMAATVWWPATIGGALGLLIAARLRATDSLPIGYVIYYVTRTILNALRSVEPLIMVIVFAVWVGIGPFAGTLAMALHTVAALSKLYSEQVENIASGPLEAVTATGANRLQTIIYAVIPQIIPPYISFTMYRWDINVRMSTIIGFAGGGGIGFLLQQNINLLNYRQASTQILAIAIVVASMDYLSTKLREKAI